MLGSKKTALALATAGAFALAGCGGGGSSAAAPTTAVEKKPDVLALLRSDTKGSLQKSAAATAKATSVTVSMQGTENGTQVNAHGVVVLGGPLKAEIVTDDPTSGTMTVRMLDNVFYIQIPAKDREGMGGKSWMKMDMSADSSAAGDMARQLDSVDPGKQLKTLLASSTVTVVGDEPIGGAKTVHYTASTPIAAYLDQIDAATRPEVQKLLAGVTEIKTDMWVDEQYLLRRTHSVEGATDVTVDYTDYGKPVTVAAPPAAETADFADLLKGFTG